MSIKYTLNIHTTLFVINNQQHISSVN